ncbi:MAG: class IV adenylate cyclase [Acidobacteriota bacterium]|nr:class IV adenylate cyclase [Acidobacteriota bacterium]
MAIEIEKKYRLTAEEREQILRRLQETEASFEGEDFEENILFGGGFLNFKSAALRVRKTEKKILLTYKQRQPSESAIKQQIEYETEIGDAETITEILKNLGYRPALVYEKRRQTWQLKNVEVVLDELPFGLFMEIEGEESEILDAEKLLEIENLPPVMETYPLLTQHHGEKRGDMIEARFK